jgi:dienelactone hydrolase
VQTKDIEYRDAAGDRYVGYLARPDMPNGAAVLVAHNAPGVDAFERGVAERLAGLGYVVLCADYVGDGRVLGGEELPAVLGPLLADTSQVRTRMEPALAALAAEPGVDAGRIAAIGYCFGGTAALELARGGADVKAVVGLHAGLPITRPEDNRAIAGKVLMLEGAADPMVPPEMRTTWEAQMNEAGIDWRMILFGGVQHAFAVPGVEQLGMPGLAYHALTDARAWTAMTDFLGETIGGDARAAD